MREVFNTLAITIFGLINIAVLLFLLMFIYTVMGVQLFAKVAYNDDFNANANFRAFGTAFLTLFRYVKPSHATLRYAIRYALCYALCCTTR